MNEWLLKALLVLIALGAAALAWLARVSERLDGASTGRRTER